MKKGWLFPLFFSALTLFGKDFGVKGHLFPIEEIDLANWIETQAQTFDSDAYAEEMKEAMMHPAPVQGLSNSVENRSYFVDFSHVDEETGDVFHPLEELEIEAGMLFFDGDNPAHVAWAKKYGDGFLLVLVKGDPLDLEQREKREVFFDQSGIWTKVLKIEHIPAKMSQKGSQILVEEVVVR